MAPPPATWGQIELMPLCLLWEWRQGRIRGKVGSSLGALAPWFLRFQQVYPSPSRGFLPRSAFPSLQPSTNASSPRKLSLVSAELHSVPSVPFKKAEATDWQATSAPQADFAWPMPKIELVANRKFYIKIPASGLTLKTGRSEDCEPPFSSGHYWRRGTHTPLPRPASHFTRARDLSGPLGI